MQPSLPHAYPFRFVDRVIEDPSRGSAAPPEVWQGTVKTLVSANGHAASSGSWGSPLLFAEAIAQAALLLEGGDPEIGRRGFLAGIDGFQCSRSARAGEALEVSVRLAARFGPVVKFEGEVRSGEEVLARGAVLVRKGERDQGPGIRGQELAPLPDP